MSIFQSFKQKAYDFFNIKGDSTNLLNRSIYSFFNGNFFTLTQNKKTYVDSGYRENITVYSLVKLIASKVADAKFRGVTYDSKGNEVDLPFNDQVNLILKRPNEDERQQQFIEALASWILLTGDFYIYKLRFISGVDKGKVNKLYYLPAQYVQIIGGGWMNPVSGYKLIIGDQEVVFPKEDITHIKYFNPNWDISGSQLYGQSPLEAALKTIQSSNEATNSKIRAFLNGGVAGLLSSDDPNNVMSVEQIAQLNDLIAGKITGSNNTKKISATNGLVKYQQIGLSPADLEVLKSLEFDTKELCKVFGVSPYLFSTDSGSYNNVKEAKKSLISDTVTPLLNLIKDAFDDIFVNEGKGVAYSIAHFPEMQQDLGEMVKSLEQAWWFTPNQRLKMMNAEVSPDKLMDKVYIPTSLVPIDEVSIPMDANLKNFDYKDE